MKAQSLRQSQETHVGVFILAGGLSTRMGRDKSRIRVTGRCLLTWVRNAAKATGWPVRIIRKDIVPRRGPLGGVLTALRRTRANVLLFLSCDMPAIKTDWLMLLADSLPAHKLAAFTELDGVAGFPFAIRRDAADLVVQLIVGKKLSLQGLATYTKARRVRIPRHRALEFININTRADLIQARSLARQ